MTTAEDLTRKVDKLREMLSKKRLSPAVLEQLDNDIEQVEGILEAQPDKPRRDIMELEGLGQELWRSIDVEAYLERERNSWRS